MISLSADPVIKLPQERRGGGQRGSEDGQTGASVHEGERGLSSEGPRGSGCKRVMMYN